MPEPSLTYDEWERLRLAETYVAVLAMLGRRLRDCDPDAGAVATVAAHVGRQLLDHRYAHDRYPDDTEDR